MKREPSAAETALAQRVRAALKDEWGQVRLLCPRGHYICDATVGVPVVDERESAPLWIWPRRSNEEWSGDMTNRHMQVAWHHPTQTTGVILTCQNVKCTYRGRRDMFTLAVEAGAAALAGAREYHLTS